MEPKGILQGGWLDGRLVGLIDKEILTAIGPGIVPAEGMVFLSSSGRTLEGLVELIKYRKTERTEDGLVVYEHVQEEPS